MNKTIKGDFSAELTGQEDYEIFLQRKNIQCLKNPAGNEIYAFAALVDGMTYTAGPERAEVKAALAEEKLEEQPLGEQKALDGELKFVNVNQKKIAGFSQDSLVFVRQETKACWEALESAFESKHNLSLEGPPGTGKSTTTWAWALWKARQQRTTVTWFHYDKRDKTKVVIDGARNCIYTGGKADTSAIEQSQGTILIVDGVTLAETLDLSRACTSWYKNHNRTGMFILVSSQAAVVAYEQDRNYQIKIHLVGSWTQQDYLLACADPTFFAVVENALKCPSFQPKAEMPKKKHKKGEDSTLDKAAMMAALVAAKYYHAGGSARWMFDMDFNEWQDDVDRHLEKVSNYTDIFKGQQGDRVAVNHLRGATKVNGKAKYFFISQYVAKQLAEKCPSSKRDFIINGYAKAEETNNPAFHGWIFEYDVEHQLDVASRTNTWVEGKEAIWNVPRYLCFDNIEDLIPVVDSMSVGAFLWAKPNRWNQPAYDFLCFSKVSSKQANLHVLNATYADTHDLLLYVVNNLACKFVIEDKLWIECIRFEFVMPSGSRFKFEVGDVTGNLVGWKNMKNAAWPSLLARNWDFADEFVVRIEMACTNDDKPVLADSIR